MCPQRCGSTASIPEDLAVFHEGVSLARAQHLQLCPHLAQVSK